MTDEQLDRFNQEGGDGTEINACEKCGLSADCIHDGVWLCVEHAVEEWYDELSVMVDPADQGYKVEYDIRVDNSAELEGFRASWFRDDFEGYIRLTKLMIIRAELKAKELKR